jgi:ABC-type nitrate/sulfonate/bicarbonate transport system permease component
MVRRSFAIRGDNIMVKAMRFIKSVVRVGIGLILGVLAGVFAGILLGLGIAKMIGLI